MTRPASGFTLLEVLVAFTIMAVALGGLLQVLGGGLRGAAEARSHAGAAFVAQSLLDAADPALLMTDGPAEGSLDAYAWRLEAIPYPDTAGPGGADFAPPGEAAEDDAAAAVPVVVRAVVRWGDRDYSVALETLRIWQADGAEDALR